MKFIKDMLINILSQGLFIIVQQVFLFPNFERTLGQNHFGRFLIVYGICNVVIITINTSFTNLYQKNYHMFGNEFEGKKALYSYYKKLLGYILAVSIAGLIALFYVDISFLTYFLLVLLILLTSSRMFLLVFYRVKKAFMKILKINMILSLFYITLLFIDMHNINEILFYFVMIEFVINVFTYVLVKVDLRMLLVVRNKSIENSALVFLLTSGCVGALMNYSDRFIINYLFDASSVTIFYIATLPTKMLLFPFTMISSVILSYLANTDAITKNVKRRVYIILPLIIGMVFILSYFLGLILIRMLYVDYVESIENIYIFVTMTFSLISADYIIRSFLVKYYSLKRKAILDTLTLVLFMLLSLVLYTISQNIVVIALAQLLTYGIKIIVQLIIFNRLETKHLK
ncbi:hypothetical protein GZH82_00460 [Staphylococcus ursi]|uniref:hypothetical protein n=1 Tax=Staphylococcus sp. MI 10-1553 TaxID=1912064 RepID=UPI0013991126|nr:hypothetical protein [Staphylococcus sp. MI 10-1553]QHW35960.1 hypothetical protein GZH82_00460 [Staphylococcus sp. MI 10-1553]